MSTITEIANRLASLCNELKFVEAYTELYADNAVSIDPVNKNEPITGLTSLIEYENRFLANAEIHSVNVSEPIFAGSYFSLVFSMHFTAKGQGTKTVEEICVYKVEMGKIVSQQFFIG
ncbi:SnoaL-like domain-containing protein [Mucilaginibacter sp. Mucisp86]|uniref:SnoaL-like domain-containing protein n=1 Tax=Mucilaginibacter sp. Mucisp86 TaxID=3243060 RepID=UPI0039B46D0A